MAEKNKDVKVKKQKEIKYRSEEQQEVIRFIIILVSIFAVVGIVYGVTKIFIKDEVKSTDDDIVAGTVNYDIVSVGTMFNRSEEEYYVALYKKSEKDAILYSSIINKYANEEKSLKVYFCDLENKFNEEYYVGNENSNPKAKTVADVKFGDFTLVKISKGKIVKYVENIEDMKKELNINTEKDNNK